MAYCSSEESCGRGSPVRAPSARALLLCVCQRTSPAALPAIVSLPRISCLLGVLAFLYGFSALFSRLHIHKVARRGCWAPEIDTSGLITLLRRPNSSSGCLCFVVSARSARARIHVLEATASILVWSLAPGDGAGGSFSSGKHRASLVHVVQLHHYRSLSFESLRRDWPFRCPLELPSSFSTCLTYRPRKKKYSARGTAVTSRSVTIRVNLGALPLLIVFREGVFRK